MMQVEVINALSASRWPGAKAASTAAIAAFRSHCEALAQVQVRLRPPELFLTYLNCVSAELLWVQAPDGRWHQVLTNSSTYLESSGTAMYIVSMAQGVERGWLDEGKFSAVIAKAWEGLATQIHDDGIVEGICDGFGIHAFESDYEAAPTLYTKSQPGLGSVLKAAVLMATRATRTL